MDKIRSFDIGSSLETLRKTIEMESLPDEFHAPVGAMVTDILSRSKQSPLSIYLCSSEAGRDARNYFGSILAKWLQKQIPTALLVDCDFTSVGMSGTVPHHDALGFLDLLLYGSSVKAITQSGRGDVKVVGAGSFPVTKKSPFAMEAFNTASRYLLSQAKCVIFCGPSEEDGGKPHPIISNVDLPIFVGLGERSQHRAPDPLETMASNTKNSQAWVVRIGRPEPVEDAAAKVADVIDELETTISMDAPVSESTPEAHEPVTRKEESVSAASDVPEGQSGDSHDGAAGPSDEEIEMSAEDAASISYDERASGSSAFPRIITTVVGVFLIGFLLWWLYLTKSVRDQVEEPAAGLATNQTADPQPPAPDPTVGSADDAGASSAGVDTGPAETVAETAQTPAGADEPNANEGQDSQVDGGSEPPPETVTMAVPPPTTPVAAGVVEAGDLNEYSGTYLVHVSSFRRIENARIDAERLARMNLPLVIAQVDLGSKGLWYRVYGGPCATQEEANKMKIKLDENPGVKFTRITKVKS